MILQYFIMAQRRAESQDTQPSLKALREAIPEHCFQSSLLKSSFYLLRDIVYASFLIYAATYIKYLPSKSLRALAWATYGFLQGCVGTGLWIIAHECGHGAFSKYPWINNLTGWVVHSLLLVPYFSWKITHARHHRYTGHLTKDTAFVPLTEREALNKNRVKSRQQFLDLVEDTPLATSVAFLIGHQLAGWQMYLFKYKTGGKQSGFEGRQERSGSTPSHFNPSSPLFGPSQKAYVILSDIGLLCTASLLIHIGLKVGLSELVLLYVIPYLWVHHWLGKDYNCSMTRQGKEAFC